LRIKKAEENRVKRFDPAKDHNYDEKCDDVLWFM
jgi:hypothetical protein